MTRRGFIKSLLGISLAGFFVAVWSFWITPAWRLRVQHWKIQTPKWTTAPLKIAVLSDIHMGEPHITLARLHDVVTRTNALNPDLILLLGDFAASHQFVKKPVPPDQYAAVLSELKAPLGVLSILGNHDYWEDQDAQRRKSGPVQSQRALEAVGIPVLENQSVALERDGDRFWIAGLGDQLAFRKPGKMHETPFAGVDDLPGTLAQIDDIAPVILAAHEPDIFPEVPGSVALTLSGHTHGGQLRFFGWSPRVPSRYGNRYAYGHVHEDGKDIVISGGIGCSILPVRLGVPPEITLVDITA